MFPFDHGPVRYWTIAVERGRLLILLDVVQLFRQAKTPIDDRLVRRAAAVAASIESHTRALLLACKHNLDLFLHFVLYIFLCDYYYVIIPSFHVELVFYAFFSSLSLSLLRSDMITFYLVSIDIIKRRKRRTTSGPAAAAPGRFLHQ